MPVLTLKNLLVSLLTLLCAVGLWRAYDWYQGRYIRTFSHQAVLFAGDTLRLPAELSGPGAIRVVHFWDPSCPCNVGNYQHLSELITRYAPQGIEFYAVQKHGTHGQLPISLGALKPLTHLPGAEHLSASPAIAIWDRSGNLAYVGPYSEGATCNASNSFVEPVLQALIQGRPANATHTLAVGCYCPWQPQPPAV